MWNPKENIYTDQTGAFPITVQSGARYVMVMVTIDANAILLCLIKNRTDQEPTKAYRTLLGRAKATGLEVKKACPRQWVLQCNERTYQIRVQAGASATPPSQEKHCRGSN